MNCHQRLLVLSCSERKNTAQEHLPAIERYNGPLFYVLRRFLRECPYKAEQLDVYILSARYGLIPADYQIDFYDQKMNLARVVELQPHIKTTFSDILRKNYNSICFVLGRTYQKAFENLQYMIPMLTRYVFTHGVIGKRQTQLKRWLWE